MTTCPQCNGRAHAPKMLDDRTDCTHRFHSTAARIHANPELLSFIPDERFKGSLRATIAGSERGDTATTGLVQASTDTAGLIHMWTWHAEQRDFNPHIVARMARQIAGRNMRIERAQRREEFLCREPDAGFATHTVYRKIDK